MRLLARWLVPVAAGAVVAGATLAQTAVAGSPPTLPPRTPEQLLASALTTQVSSFSGTISWRTDLGLPALPAQARTAPSLESPTALLTRALTGQNTVRVWVDGPQRQRAQLLDQFSELDVVHSGRDVWTYSSSNDTGTHLTLPATASSADPVTTEHPIGSLGALLDGSPPPTPQALAQQALAAVGPTTAITSGAPATVAGRATYTLVITPRTNATLVDHAVIALDAASGVPLRAQIYARGHTEPAIEAGFTSFSTDRPTGARFRFTPPDGATIRESRLPSGAAGLPDSPASNIPAHSPRLVGSGWTAIVELPAGTLDPGTLSADPSGSRRASTLLQQAAVAVPEGRLIRTSLLTILVTTDGRVLAGAVPAAALQAAAHTT